MASEKFKSRRMHFIQAGQSLRRLRCFPEVYQRLLRGESVPKVAEYIQTIAREATEMDRRSLERSLYRYRDSIPPISFVSNLPPRAVPPVVREKVLEAMEGLNEVDELTELYKDHKKRYRKFMENEEQLGMEILGITNTMKEAREVLRTSATIKMELGLYDRVAEEVNIRSMNIGFQITPEIEESAMKRVGALGLGKVIENENSLRRVLEVVRELRRFSSPTDNEELSQTNNNNSGNQGQLEPDAAEVSLIAEGQVAEAQEVKEEVIDVPKSRGQRIRLIKHP